VILAPHTGLSRLRRKDELLTVSGDAL
jgi:hypothetical protein